MNNAALLGLPLLLLTACAGPADVIEQGHRFQFTSVQGPKTAAHCIARNSERQPFMRAASPTIREGLKEGSYEVIVNVPTLATTDAVAIIEPASGGSLILVYALGPRDFYEARALEYVEGCAVESPRKTQRPTALPEQRQSGTASER